MGFNRKERLKMAKKIGNGSRATKDHASWHMLKLKKKNDYETKLIQYNEAYKKEKGIYQKPDEKDDEKMDTSSKPATINWQKPKESSAATETLEASERPKDQYKSYTLAVALPGSILNNAQGPELRTYLAGQIARTCAIFCVDEIVIFDETAQITDKQISSYYSDTWTANERVDHTTSECNLHLAKILEYLECPQYLRKHLFPIQKPLKFSGVLNPLDCTHHLRATDRSIPYREGVVLNKPYPKGVLVDVGLDKDLSVRLDYQIPPKTRITVKMVESSGTKRYRGEIINAKKVNEESGIYWGYTVKLAKSLSDAVKGYDMIIGTSERGVPVKETNIPFVGNKRVVVVFGGLDGLESAVKADDDIAVTDPADIFSIYVNALPGQGSRIIRTEEAIPITLLGLKDRLNSL